MKPQLPSFRAGDEEARDVTTGMRTWQESLAFVSAPWGQPQAQTGEPRQRGQQESIRATAALGSSCRYHPVPRNSPSPPCRSSSCQWP